MSNLILYTIEVRGNGTQVEFEHSPMNWDYLLDHAHNGFANCPGIIELWLRNKAEPLDKVLLWRRK